ncbi:MAG TPA: DUF433 domain-containing protein [Hyphomonadaceae bacterium]|jgi:uncharacterized protein (DUF433 family)|nr:DUF433 domain-containing protein [Hyphomonadaceae bacterium]
MGSPLIIRDPDIMSGEPVFADTRVPAKTLTDYWIAGGTINEFLDDFPTVTREQVVRFLKDALEVMCADARNASSIGL